MAEWPSIRTAAETGTSGSCPPREDRRPRLRATRVWSRAPRGRLMIRPSRSRRSPREEWPACSSCRLPEGSLVASSKTSSMLRNGHQMGCGWRLPTNVSSRACWPPEAVQRSCRLRFQGSYSMVERRNRHLFPARRRVVVVHAGTWHRATAHSVVDARRTARKFRTRAGAHVLHVACRSWRHLGHGRRGS